MRQYIEPHLNRGGVALIIGIDFQGPLGRHVGRRYYRDRDIKCPRNLYYLVKDYLKERKAVMTVNNSSAEKAISRGFPQGACCGPGL